MAVVVSERDECWKAPPDWRDLLRERDEARESLRLANLALAKEMDGTIALRAQVAELREACEFALAQLDKSMHGERGGYDPLRNAKQLRAALAKTEPGR